MNIKLRYFTLQITQTLGKKEQDNKINEANGIEGYINSALSKKTIVARKNDNPMFSFNINIIDKNILKFDNFDRGRIIASADINNNSLYKFLTDYFSENSCEESKLFDSNLIFVSDILIQNENLELVLETIDSVLKDINVLGEYIFIERKEVDLEILAASNYLSLNENFAYKRYD